MLSRLMLLPWSFWWLILTGIVFLLQVVPVIGVFLTFSLAPFWSVVTINLFFISLTVEASIGGVRRVWLLLPLAWFVGYYAVADLSHQEVAALDRQIRASNEKIRIPFDPQTTSLVVTVGSGELDRLAETIVAESIIRVAYRESRESEAAEHRAYRILRDPVCSRLRADQSYIALGVRTSGVRDQTAADHEPAEGICLGSWPEDPRGEKLMLSSSTTNQAGHLASFSLTTIHVSQKARVIATLTMGVAKTLAPLPMPIIGCAFGSHCSYGFFRTSVGIGSRSVFASVAAFEVLAAALPIDRMHASRRKDSIPALAPDALDAVVQQRASVSLANLERALADPRVRISMHEVAGLGDRPALYRARAAAMVGTIRRALALGGDGFLTAKTLQMLIAYLPKQDFDAIGPGVIDILEQQPKLDRETVDAVLANRLGSLGMIAAPLLERLAFERNGPINAALLGLCRIGDEASGYGERISSIDLGRWKDHDFEPAVFVTLKRIGRADLVERAEAQGRFKSISKTQRELNISPASPASVCASAGGWPRIVE